MPFLRVLVPPHFARTLHETPPGSRSRKDLSDLSLLARGERGSQHIPEFTLLEWYRAHSDYLGLMEDCEALILHVASALA